MSAAYRSHLETVDGYTYEQREAYLADQELREWHDEQDARQREREANDAFASAVYNRPLFVDC